jgi:hypothetical protein
MDINALSEWLKNTVPGIVILGAIGSIIAAGAIWLAGRYLPKVVRRSLVAVRTRIILHFVQPSVAQALRLYVLRTKKKTQLFYTFQLMKLLLALFFALCGFVAFLFSLSLQSETLYQPSVIGPLVVFFMGFWYALQCLAIVVVPLYFDLESQIETAIDKQGLSRSESSNA